MGLSVLHEHDFLGSVMLRQNLVRVGASLMTSVFCYNTSSGNNILGVYFIDIVHTGSDLTKIEWLNHFL